MDGMDGWMDGWMGGWMDGWMDRWMDDWTDGTMDQRMGAYPLISFLPNNSDHNSFNFLSSQEFLAIRESNPSF
jgi:hypothetical protein